MTAEDPVVLLSDLQSEILDRGCRTLSAEELRLSVSVLVEGAATLGVPVLSSIIPIGHGHEPQAIGELEHAITVMRTTVGAFQHPATAEAIADLGRRVIVVGGVTTEVAVLHTVLGALEAGYTVHVLTDLCGGFHARTESAALEQMMAAGAVLSSVPSFLTGLIGSLSDAEGQAVLAGLSRLWSRREPATVL